MFSVQMFMLKSWNLFWHTNIFSSTTSDDEYVVCAVLKGLTHNTVDHLVNHLVTFAHLVVPLQSQGFLLWQDLFPAHHAWTLVWYCDVRVWECETSPLHLFSLRRKFRLRMPLQQCMDRVQAWTKVLDNAFHKRADKFCTPVSLWCSWCTQGVMSGRDVMQKWEQTCVLRTFGSIVEGVMLLICWRYHTGTSGHIAI